ncbi:P-loop containing nucleoside triphosphate hydrolase protein [Abortiporus biennis]|nr:P-loop containing nucleoside triphosphate hydrolase protein [Abortiporus biennis]
MLAGEAEFEYDGVQFKYYRFTLRDYQTPFFDALIYDLPSSTLASPAELDSLTEKLVTRIYNFGANVQNQIWVFEAGQWFKSSELYHSIQNSSFDDIVLEDEFIDGLRRDTRSFFENKDVYRSLGIAWKRGILLLGPPGNGKTESIKALLNEMKDYPALYVKSFTTQQGPEHGIRTIFQHARNHSPCILILEDLDSMVVNEVRSFFLNELDGLAQNDGILTIATTNHPERIDDAILNRPSRFDVKYTFDLPDFELRKAYATKWILKTQKKHKKMIRFKRDVNELAHEVANRTEGWSFAFLKELYVFLLSITTQLIRLPFFGS